MKNTDYDDQIIRLKTLEKEYAVTIGEYIETKKNFIEALNQELANKKQFVDISNKEWLGKELKTISNVNKVTDCISLCVENDCTGANYNTASKYCYLKTNPSYGIRDASQDNMAIVTNSFDKAMSLSLLNEKLLDLNSQLMQLIQAINPSYKKDIEEKQVKEKEMYENYKKLIAERDYINKQLNDYNSLVASYQTENLNAKREYTFLNIWLILAIVSIILILQQMIGFSFNYSIILVFAFVLLFGLNLGSASGFLLWLSVLLFFIIMYYANVSSTNE